MANELQRNNGLFGDMMQDWFGNNFFNNANLPFNSNYMKTDIAETAKQYRVKVDMPGFDKKDIHISYNDDLLTVTVTPSMMSPTRMGTSSTPNAVTGR